MLGVSLCCLLFSLIFSSQCSKMNEEFVRMCVAVLYGEYFAPSTGPELTFLREKIVDALSKELFSLFCVCAKKKMEKEKKYA